MVIQLFFGDKLKEYFFRNIMDGRHRLNFLSEETGLGFDVEIFIEVNNGVKTIAGSAVRGVYYEDKRENFGRIIENDAKLLLRIKGTEKALGILMFESGEDITVFRKYIADKRNIEIGKNGDIIYKYDGRINKYFDICHESDKTYVVPHINRIYHEGELIKDKKRIRFGEIISYNKFKLVYLGNILAVNNPDGEVSCNLRGFKYPNPPKEAERSSEPQRFFTRSPGILHRIISETIEIYPPTAKRENSVRPALLAIGPSMTMSLAMIVSVTFMISSGSSGRSIVPSAVMACSMFAGAVIWPLLTRRYNKKKEIEDEENRKTKYIEYIDETEKILKEKAEYNKGVYEEMYPDISELYRRVRNKETTLWNQSPYDEGFFDIRIGRGSRPFSIEMNIPKEKFTLEDDPLRSCAQAVKDKYSFISDVPVSVDLKKLSSLGIVGSSEKRKDLLNLMMAEVVITHCYSEVKIGAIFSEDESEFCNFAKRLPHIWEKGRKVRFAACDKEGAYGVIKIIKDVYEERLEERENNKTDSFLPHYVVFIEDSSLLENNSGIKEFVHEAEGLGITFVFACDKIGELPLKCRNIIQLSDGECTVYDKDDNSGKMTEFIPDSCKNIDLDKLSESLAPIRINEVSEEASLPESLGFFDMYKARNTEELAIEDRWRNADVSKSLASPLGAVSGGGVFSLDLHEKGHGPHGLIAGTTGSGKSEFIMSYILSMAVNYSPNDIAFVLIDYKGGGMANAFVDLPHTAGIITNLGGNQIKRSMSSIQSEIRRRQRVLKEASFAANVDVKDINEYYKLYKRGVVTEPMPHLLMIFDEFAELKSQEPEFMANVISAARIGRSLGVHLILATQNPSGVVNDQIWSNTNFRVCLKVPDRSVSKEVLKRDEAAYITNPGRAYVQVGNDELFVLVQSGYSGLKYIKDGSNISDSGSSVVNCIDLLGRELSSYNGRINNMSGEDQTQLRAIVGYIKEFSRNKGVKAREIWLPELPKSCYLEELGKRPGGFNGKVWEETKDYLLPVVGIYDDPSNQSQGLAYADFIKDHHAVIYGSPGTGKTVFVESLIYGLAMRYSPDVVNMYILNYGSKSLGYCKSLPHVGDVLFSAESDKLKRLFPRLEAEIEARKKLFEKYSAGNMEAYFQAGGERIPAIMVIIDNYAAFNENYGSEHGSKIEKLVREGSNYGIYLVITAVAINTVKSKIQQNISLNFVLQMNDSYDYMTLLGRKNDGSRIEPEKVKGRGLVKLHDVLEFQIPLAVKGKNDAEISALMKERYSLMAESWKGKVPAEMPVIPDDMRLGSLLGRRDFSEAADGGLIPVGYDVDAIQLVSYDPVKKPFFLISGEPGCGKTNTLVSIAQASGMDVWLYDREGEARTRFSQDVIKGYCHGSEGIDQFADKLISEAVNRHNAFKEYNGEFSREEFIDKYPKIMIAIDDFGEFFDNVSEEALSKIGVLTSKTELGFYFTVSVSSGSHGKFKSQDAVKKIFNTANGVVLGGTTGLNGFGISVPYGFKSDSFEGKGYFVNKNKFCTVKLPFAE